MTAATRGVIFDLFQTLTGLESERSDLPATSEVLGVDRGAWDQILTLRSRWRLAGGERDPYRIVRRMAHEIDPTIADERIREAAEMRVSRFRHSLMSVPKANVEALKQLREDGLRLGLISNADTMEIAAWTDCPLAGLFDVEVFSCEVGLVKPEPAIYRRCLEALALEAGECLFVGDGGSNELLGARQAGLRTVFVSGVIAGFWPERIPQRLGTTDHHIEWLPQILDLLGPQATGGILDGRCGIR